MTGYPNWFADNGVTNFENNLLPLVEDKPMRMLQIGAYTGDASIWLYDNILKNSGSVLVDVDTWEGSEEPSHYEMNWGNVESVYDTKTSQARSDRKILKIKSTSDWFFKNNREMYDFIYVDGDHTAYGVIKDAIASYECLNAGGIIAFDDYQWSAGLGFINEPKLAIDTFFSIYSQRVELLVDGYQRWFRKVR
jgi:predicted O-methyltransferase YrrM